MPSRFRFKHSARILILSAAACLPAHATLTGVVGSGAGTGAERCLTGAAGVGSTCGVGGAYSSLSSMIQLFADLQGLTLTRIDDSSDQIWKGSANAGIFGLARSASRDFTLGVIPGDVGNLAGYSQVLAVIGSAGANTEYLPSIPPGQNANGDLIASPTYNAQGRPIFTGLAAQYQNGTDFRFAIQQVTATNPDLWSSNPTDNRDLHDHLVTWQLTGQFLTNKNLTWYVAGFENAVFPGSDGDFNDYAFVFQNVAPLATPEPNSALLVAGMAALLLIGRRAKA